ncbi:hypothetical protein A2850_02230 [Candidatus Azambacteria bacterium RIFCSPHIGHO2_01_FULL_51_74]|nr:MAG: hypothetical protein A2850_02230 [Candidatus Azambacteria bacterium RIFCSPHIGHO2_01_FULL_51_74]
MASSFNKIGSFHRFWSVFCHNQFLEQGQNAIFQTYSQRVSPFFFAVMSHVDDLFIYLVSSIYYGKRIHRFKFSKYLAKLAEVQKREKKKQRA